MKKYILFFSLLFLVNQTKSQSTITFSIINTSNSSNITCAHPTINLVCISNYTAAFVTYIFTTPSSTTIGNSFSVSNPGTYSITAFVNSQVNSTQTLAIGINTTAPTSVVSPTFQSITCNPNSITSVSASASPTSNITHQFISASGATLSISGSTASFLPSGTGTYTHSLINDINGCKANKTFVVNGPSSIPSLSLNCPQNYTIGCGPNNPCVVSMFGQSSPPGPISYTMLSVSSTTNYLPNSQNVYSLTAAGTYTAVVKDIISGCEIRTPFSVSLNTTAPVPSIFASTQTLSCLNPQITLVGFSNVQNVNFNWTFVAAPGSASGQTVNVNTTGLVTNSIIGIYTLTATDNDNLCAGTTIITMYQNIFQPNAVVTNTSNSQITCLAPFLLLNNASTTGIPAGTGFPNLQPVGVIQWVSPTTASVPVTNNSFSVYLPGTYTLQVLDANNGCTNTAVSTIIEGRNYPEVNTPVAPPAYCLDPPTNALSISPILSGNTNNQTYFWVLPGTATVSGQGTPTLNTNAVGVYSVLVTNTVNGCTSVGQLSVTVCTGMKADEQQTIALIFYPNPSKDLFAYNLDKGFINAVMEIYTPSGVLVFKEAILTSFGQIDLSQVPSGLYFAHLKNSEGSSVLIKLLKE